MSRVYETHEKINGKYCFVGWNEMLNEEFCIKTRTRKVKDKDFQNGKWVDTIKTYIYKTYTNKDNTELIDVRYGAYIDQ